ncbi:hypothetical protein XNC3_3080001 [Xenorhabdus nematophila F1]|nr:hypothetical protein XNC3_3080001 [Xenorhabdus nematophila F1]
MFGKTACCPGNLTRPELTFCYGLEAQSHGAYLVDSIHIAPAETRQNRPHQNKPDGNGLTVLRP